MKKLSYALLFSALSAFASGLAAKTPEEIALNRSETLLSGPIDRIADLSELAVDYDEGLKQFTYPNIEDTKYALKTMMRLLRESKDQLLKVKAEDLPSFKDAALSREIEFQINLSVEAINDSLNQLDIDTQRLDSYTQIDETYASDLRESYWPYKEGTLINPLFNGLETISSILEAYLEGLA